MNVKEIVGKYFEDITIDIFSGTASQFLWGEIDAPEELKEEEE